MISGCFFRPKVIFQGRDFKKPAKKISSNYEHKLLRKVIHQKKWITIFEITFLGYYFLKRIEIKSSNKRY